MHRLFILPILVFLMSTPFPVEGVVYQVGAFEHDSNRNDRVNQLREWDFDVQFDTSSEGLTRVRTADLTPRRARHLRTRLKKRGIAFFPVAGSESPVEPADSSIRRNEVPRQRLEQALGTPYQWGGESPTTGFDCSGLLVWLLPHPDMPRTVQSLRVWSKPVQAPRVQPGDLVFFGFESSTADHVGLITGSDTFVHASRNEGVVRSPLDRTYYRKRILGYGRAPARKSGVR